MAGTDDAVELPANGRAVRLTHPEKVLFPERGWTKRDVAAYYTAVGDGIVRALRGRPTTLERYPDGVAGKSFFQKRAPSSRPRWVATARVGFASGRTADELRPEGLDAVLWAVNLACLTFHPWPVRAAALDHPDELRIDLDPQPGTGYGDAVRAAVELREVLADLGLTGWPKTSGGRGLHVFVPLVPEWDFTTVRRAGIAVARALERRAPDRITTSWWKEERGRRIFVDYNQMARDRTMASAYSVRPNPAGTVSAPLRWEELAEVTPGDFDLVTMGQRWAELGDVHGRMADLPCRLDAALELAEQDARDHALEDLPYPPNHPRAPGEPVRVQPSRRRSRGGNGGRNER